MEKINYKNINNVNPEDKILLVNDVKNKLKNSESVCIQDLVSQNYELKTLILKVSCF